MKISASTNPPSQALLKGYVAQLNSEDVDFIHVDIMDGKFVSNKTFDYKFMASLREVTSIPFDVHLMTINPQRTIKKYIKAGADIVSVHYEAFKNDKSIQKTLQKIRKLGGFAGLSFRPSTPVENILPLLPYVDVLLVMSVEPGKSGQQFILETLNRLDIINSYIKEQCLTLVVEVDGGVNEKNIKFLKERGVDMVVLGNYLFTSKHLAKSIDKIKC